MFLFSPVRKFISFKIAVILSVIFSLPINSLEQAKANSGLSEGLIAKKENTRSSQYILGPGDNLLIKFIGLNEFSNIYIVDPYGELYLPELGKVQVEGLSVEGLTKELETSYQEFIKSPEIEILISGYRPINISVMGEVRNPGKYTLSGLDDSTGLNGQSSQSSQSSQSELRNPVRTFYNDLEKTKQNNYFDKQKRTIRFPTLYEAIRASGGITEFSDLTKIQIIRRNSIDLGGGFLQTTVNLLPELTGQYPSKSSQNINIMDGDIIKISKSSELITNQILLAMRSNINPSEIMVFLSGQIEEAGQIILPNGSSLNQAIANAGGKTLFGGNIEFMRFQSDGKMNRRSFKYSPLARLGDYKNPILVSGDIIFVKRSAFGYATDTISTITRPFVGLASLYTILGIDNE